MLTVWQGIFIAVYSGPQQRLICLNIMKIIRLIAVDAFVGFHDRKIIVAVQGWSLLARNRVDRHNIVGLCCDWQIILQSEVWHLSILNFYYTHLCTVIS